MPTTWTFVKKVGAPAGAITFTGAAGSYTIDDTTNTSITVSSYDAQNLLAASPYLTLQGAGGTYTPPPVIADVFTADGVLSTGSRFSPSPLSVSGASALSRTSVKSTSYASAAGELVVVDASAATVPITLPNAPVDKSQVTIKAILLTAPNTVTVSTQGADVLNAAGGATTYTLRGLNQTVTFQYDATTKVWTVVSSDVPLTFTDARYANPVGSRVFFVGDSQVQKGVADSNADGTGTSYAPLLQGRAWYAWAMMAAEGQLAYAGQAATGGYTTAQILATHLAAAQSQAARLVCVLAGRNDVVNGVAFATTVSNLKQIYDGLYKVGKIPVLCTLPAQPAYPTATAAQVTAVAKINAWIRNYALFNQWPLVDFEAATTDPTTGGQKAGMFVDASHPNPGLGARTMGTEFYNKIKPYLAPYKPLFAVAQTNTANGDLNLIPNPLNLTLTGAAGTDPVGWSAATETGTGTLTTYDPATTGNDGLGLWARLARTSGSGVMRRATAKIAVTPGDLLAFSARFKAANVEANSAWISLQLVGYSASGDDPVSGIAQYLAGIKSWRGDVAAPGLYAQPPIAVAAGINYVALMAVVSSGSGAANLDFGQLALFNLTQIGALS